MPRRIAFLFPGQGSTPERLPQGSEEVKSLLRMADEAGLPLMRWMDEQRVERLAQADAAQPSLFLDSLCRAHLLTQAGWTAHCVAGHSLGEYAAYVHSGVLYAEDAMRAVIERGRLTTSIPGCMAAILKLDWSTVVRLCEEVDAVAANHNSPHQVVISGEEDAVQAVLAKAEGLGGRGIRLKVSGPFHSPRMVPAQEALKPLLEGFSFSPPRIPVISGVLGDTVTEPEILRALLIQQMTSPVRWVHVTEALIRQKVDTAVEVGTSHVLAELGKRSGAPIRFLPFEEAMNERLSE